VDVDYYKWGAKVDTTDGESLKSIVSCVLHSRQYNRYIMGIKCDQQGKHTKERVHGADPDPKILIFDTELMQEPPTEMEKRTVSGST